MKRKLYLAALLAVLCLTVGCSSESISDRVYAQAMALHCGADTVTLTLQGFDTRELRTVCAPDLPSALNAQEVLAGGRVFLGHTELVVIDESVGERELMGLFFDYGISPDCIVMEEEHGFLETHDASEVVRQIREARRNHATTAPLAWELREYLEQVTVNRLQLTGNENA